MIEKKINLVEIDPVEIYGVNNRIFDLFCSYFPKVKAVARGTQITVRGTQKDISMFESKLNGLIMKRMSKTSLTDYDVEEMFRNDGQPAGTTNPVDGITANANDYVICYGNEGRVIKARTRNQKKLVEEYYKNDLLFAVGPAGTGKTYTAIALAVRALKNREVKKIILTRPAVEAGERLGFLPGDLKEKLDPYLQPLYDALKDMIPGKKLEMFMEDGVIQIAPLAYMRGRTLDKAVVILDEAQNTSLGQLKMFLTRMGFDAKFIVTGDATQIDLPDKKDSGLLRGIELVKGIQGISVINFDKEDIVRHPLVTRIVEAFGKAENDSTSH
ncbi:MAG: PhoH family protein [Bacteroidales bacterium]|jgi:phosphate starvation-inducible PhoH-like protein|nr:PhoH family protein [Bacteroidales bacterium]MCI2121513.1 PhoH family protein [Bacteroidales bacterium]MCI2145545.1 PhoH family protein [Bacteroidales bacterium]